MGVVLQDHTLRKPQGGFLMYQQFDKAVQCVLDYFHEHGFSNTVCKDFRRYAKDLKKYLEHNHFPYSPAITQHWLVAGKTTIPRGMYVSRRRAVSLIDHAAKTGAVTNGRFSYEDAPLRKYGVPQCYSPLLADYLERRRQEGNGTSTLQMDRSACTRFLLFLDSRSIVKVASITPQIIKAYHTQSRHQTAEGKNAYTRRIRGFIRFLAERDLVPQALESAFPMEQAARVSIVTTLSAEQVEAIRAFAERSSSPSELRSAAMTVLALRLGLRSVDICNLRLSDVCWKTASISIIQQKTGKPLTLPFPVEVGNLLARYILEGRPDCEAPQVFVTLKHPYTRLHSSKGCYNSTLAVFGRKETPTDLRGLHLARRTFASNLLACGNPVSTISSALGHADESTVDEYLATDLGRMGLCAIGLSGIELPEAKR